MDQTTSTLSATPRWTQSGPLPPWRCHDAIDDQADTVVQFIDQLLADHTSGDRGGCSFAVQEDARCATGVTQLCNVGSSRSDRRQIPGSGWLANPKRSRICNRPMRKVRSKSARSWPASGRICGVIVLSASSGTRAAQRSIRR